MDLEATTVCTLKTLDSDVPTTTLSPAPTEMSGWWEEATTSRDALRSAGTTPGEQSAMTSGEIQMLRSCAGSWDTEQLVSWLQRKTRHCQKMDFVFTSYNK